VQVVRPVEVAKVPAAHGTHAEVLAADA